MTKKERMFTLARRLWLVVQMLPDKTFNECKKWLDEIEQLLNEEMEEESIPVEWINKFMLDGHDWYEYDLLIEKWRKENESNSNS